MSWLHLSSLGSLEKLKILETCFSSDWKGRAQEGQGGRTSGPSCGSWARAAGPTQEGNWLQVSVTLPRPCPHLPSAITGQSSVWPSSA